MCPFSADRYLLRQQSVPFFRRPTTIGLPKMTAATTYQPILPKHGKSAEFAFMRDSSGESRNG
jgi:hypothetical protein